MAKISVTAGSTSVTLPIFIQASTSTTGLGLAGLTGTAASLIGSYYRGTGTDVPITLTTSTLNAPYTSGLIVEINSTRMAGAYRFDPPDAALAAGPRSVFFMLSGAANMAPLPFEVELTAWNNQDSVAGGMTQLTSTGTLGSVSNVRGTATVLLAGAVHTGAIIPIVQTSSLAQLVGTATSVLNVNVVATASNTINVLGTATVILFGGVHTGAIVPIVQTASGAKVTDFTTAALSRFFDIDAGSFSTASANSVVTQITTNAGGGSLTALQITTAVWAKFGTGTVALTTGTHAGAFIPNVGAINTSSDGRMANLDLNVGAVQTSAIAGMALSTSILDKVGTSGVAISTSTMTTIADKLLDRDMGLGPDTGVGTGTAGRTVRQALRPLRNHWTAASGTYTSFKEDDTTISYAKPLISTSTADLIIGMS